MIKNNKLNTSQKIALLTAALKLENEDILNLKTLLTENPNWQFIQNFAEKNGTAPLFYKNILKNNFLHLVPENVLLKFKSIYYQTQSNNLLALNQLKKVLAAFNQKGIKTVLIKGIASAEFIYKDLGLRPMGDVDIMVEQERITDAESLLFDLGFINEAPYKSYKLRTLSIHNHLNAFVNNKVKIELHNDLTSKHHIYRIPVKKVWENVEEINIEGQKAFILSLNHNIQYLSIHSVQHFLKKKIRLNSFSDIAELIKQQYSNIKWDVFVEECYTNKIILPVYRALYLCNTYLQTHIPEDIINKLNTGDDNLEEEFIHLLNNRTDKIKYKVPSNYIKKISAIDGLKNKCRYLWAEVFPSKEYIAYTYGLKNKNMMVFFYFNQFFKQVFKMFRNIFQMLKRGWDK